MTLSTVLEKMNTKGSQMSKQDKVNILLVDDNRINLIVLERMLEDLKECLICAESGEQALLEIAENDFAVILLDVQMPGLSGFEVASSVRSGARNQATPIIFLTALEGSMDSVLQGYSAGAVDYIIKPCEPEIIKSKVKVFVDLYRMKEMLARQSELEKERELEKKNARELAALNQELERSNQVLTQLAYSASHDLSEPLRTVNSCLQMLERKFGSGFNEEAKEYLDFAVSGAQRMQGLLQDVLSYTELSVKPMNLERLDSADALNAAIASLGSLIDESSAEIENGPLPIVLADSTQLAGVFKNLIHNAIKYCETTPLIRVSAERAGDCWQFAVADNGVGIEPEYHDQLFKMFKRMHGPGKSRGSGIGLAKCELIVHRHGGAITLDSRPGKGSVFYFTIPATIQSNSD